jgi:hypothetical protein
VNSQSRIKIFSGTAHALAALILIVVGASASLSQIPPQQPSPSPPQRPIEGAKNPDESPLTTLEEELRAKREIKMAEKDHQENLNRAREIGEIGKELKQSLKDKSTLDRDCLKRIERLEKLTKKVRGEAGGEDEEVSIADRPTDLSSAATQIADAAQSLAKEVQNTPRRVVSASVICHANVLLELIKVTRTFVRQQP